MPWAFLTEFRRCAAHKGVSSGIRELSSHKSPESWRVRSRGRRDPNGYFRLSISDMPRNTRQGNGDRHMAIIYGHTTTFGDLIETCCHQNRTALALYLGPFARRSVMHLFTQILAEYFVRQGRCQGCKGRPRLTQRPSFFGNETSPHFSAQDIIVREKQW